MISSGEIQPLSSGEMTGLTPAVRLFVSVSMLFFLADIRCFILEYMLFSFPESS